MSLRAATLVQHWSFNAGRSKPTGIVRCLQCQSEFEDAYEGSGTPMPGYVTGLSPSAARNRRCAVCGVQDFRS